jgi:hypothetical protein
LAPRGPPSAPQPADRMQSSPGRHHGLTAGQDLTRQTQLFHWLSIPRRKRSLIALVTLVKWRWRPVRLGGHVSSDASRPSSFRASIAADLYSPSGTHARNPTRNSKHTPRGLLPNGSPRELCTTNRMSLEPTQNAPPSCHVHSTNRESDQKNAKHDQCAIVSSQKVPASKTTPQAIAGSSPLLD